MASLMLVNPRKRRTKRKTTARKAPARRRSNPVAKRASTSVRKYRRNPIPRMGGMVETMKDGAVGAAGAVATEIILSKLPLPTALSSGNGRVAASALGSIGVGMLVARFGRNKKLGKTMAQGGVTVALHSLMRGAASNIPGVGLDGYGSGGLLGMDDGLLGADFDDLGYYSAAPTYDTPSSMDGYFDMDDY